FGDHLSDGFVPPAVATNRIQYWGDVLDPRLNPQGISQQLTKAQAVGVGIGLRHAQSEYTIFSEGAHAKCCGNATVDSSGESHDNAAPVEVAGDNLADLSLDLV